MGDLDVAIIRLDTDAPIGFPPVTLDVREPRVGETAFLVGHPLGAQQFVSNIDCYVAPEQVALNDTFKHACDTFAGNSGSIVFASADGAAIGVHVTDEGTGNIAVKTAAIARESSNFRALVRTLDSSPPPPPPCPRDPWCADRCSMEAVKDAIYRLDIESIKARSEAGCRLGNKDGPDITRILIDQLYQSQLIDASTQIALLDDILKIGGTLSILEITGLPYYCDKVKRALYDHIVNRGGGRC